MKRVVIALVLGCLVAGLGTGEPNRRTIVTKARLVEVSVSKPFCKETEILPELLYVKGRPGISLGFLCDDPLMKFAKTWGELELTECKDAAGTTLKPIDAEQLHEVNYNTRCRSADKYVLGVPFRFACPKEFKGPIRVKGSFKVHCRTYKEKLIKGFARGHANKIGDQWTIKSDGRQFDFTRDRCDLRIVVSNAADLDGLGLVDSDGKQGFDSGNGIVMGDKVFYTMAVQCYDIDIYDLVLKLDAKDVTVTAEIDEDQVALPY